MPLVRKPGLAPAVPVPEAAEILQALNSPSADQRWSAARAAAALPPVMEALVKALSVEGDARVREAMLTSLAQIGTRDSIAPLLSMLRSDQAALRTAALDALRLTPHLPALIGPLTQDPDVDVRLLSCDLVRSLPAAEANAVLSALLQHEVHPNVCAAAVEVLAEVGDTHSLASLAACAQRFPGNEFLRFAIKIVRDRIQATSASARV